jgi:UDP-N-acetylglucosamine--N-acetylmuramyl-(pentapeptide) pyrophosphoryl-undecaprenol N-acetylglucosamine transferase
MTESQQAVSVLIAAGGTAGHVLPALAVAEELQARGARVTFAGSPDRLEARLVPEAGFVFHPYRVSGLPRRPGMELLRALMTDARALRAAGRIVDSDRPDVVLGGGGYVAGPVVAAAARRRLPAAVMEADAHLGLANRLAAPLARRVFLSFPIDGRNGDKYRVTGRPIPRRSKAPMQDEARTLFRLPLDGQVLLVFGGSQGARPLNELTLESFGEVGPAVLHLSGERDYDSLARRVTRDDYRLVPFTNEVGAAYAAADLVLARSGGSVWELAAAGLPAVLVPYPFATADHQTKNARYFERVGGAVVVPETELGSVPALVRSLIDDPDRLARMREAMLAAARPDAAATIAEDVLALAAA